MPVRHANLRIVLLRRLIAYASFVPVFIVYVCVAAGAQSPPAPSQSPSPPAQTLAQNPGAVTISLDDAIQMALQHNHNLLAARTTIQQSEAEEITANLRPNPVLLGDCAVSADFSAKSIQRRLPRQHGAVRSGRQLSV